MSCNSYKCSLLPVDLGGNFLALFFILKVPTLVLSVYKMGIKCLGLFKTVDFATMLLLYVKLLLYDKTHFCFLNVIDM